MSLLSGPRARGAVIGAASLIAMSVATAMETPASTVPSTVPATSASGPIPGLRLIDLSVGILAVGGGSTADDAGISTLQLGAHDPAKRGFTLQQVELSASGAVDPWFIVESHIIFVEDAVELEEAFATTSSLPYGLQAKGGLFFTEFGRNNPSHPHSWNWVDQPLINSRIFGGDGSRSVGVRLGWLVPTPWYSQFQISVQNADNPTQVSFLGFIDEDDDTVTIGGRPVVPSGGVHALGDLVYTVRWEHGGEVGDTALKAGSSAMFGPNASGSGGTTRIYGVDLAAKWVPPGGRRGYPFVLIEVEGILRDYHADDGVAADTTPIAADDLRDQGFYAQVFWGFSAGWAVGLRVERASGSGDDVDPANGAVVDRNRDPFRSDRTRLAPVLEWRFSHFARLRLQYDYDRAKHLADDDAHSVWLGGEWLIGAHPAHGF